MIWYTKRVKYSYVKWKGNTHTQIHGEIIKQCATCDTKEYIIEETKLLQKLIYMYYHGNISSKLSSFASEVRENLVQIFPVYR